MRPTLHLALLVALSSGCHLLDHDVAAAVPQRPTVSSDTGTTAHETFELEAGVTVDPGDLVSLPTSLKYGLTEQTEVFATWSPLDYLQLPGEDQVGPGDLVLGARSRFAEQTDGRPSFAIQSQVKLPTANDSEGLGTGELDFSLAGIATRAFEDVTVTGYLQVDVLGDPAGGTDLGQKVAVAAARGLPDDVGVFAEVAGIFVPEKDDTQGLATLGATYTLSPALVLDAGVVLGFGDDAPDVHFLVGFTRNLGKLLY
jgi:hypothetical protein